MTVIVLLSAAIFLLLVILAEMCILAHRLEEVRKQAKYNVTVEMFGRGVTASQEAIRDAMLRRPS